jgi:hypothetical protein
LLLHELRTEEERSAAFKNADADASGKDFFFFFSTNSKQRRSAVQHSRTQT